MQKLYSIEQAKTKILSDIRKFLTELHNMTKGVDSIEEGILNLIEIRRVSYEDLNQIQHEHLVLQGIIWLQNNGYGSNNIEWYWNPRQTGDINEVDIQAKIGSRVVLCGEATASENPKGSIDSRMRDTLRKLDNMQGRKYYFVLSDPMEKRAKTKVEKNSLRIDVIKIHLGA